MNRAVQTDSAEMAALVDDQRERHDAKGHYDKV